LRRRRLVGTLVVAAGLGAGVFIGQLSRPEEAIAIQFCAGKAGYLYEWEGTELIFTQTHRTYAYIHLVFFYALRRRPDYTIAISVHGQTSPWDFQNSVDVNRRSEIGREDQYHHGPNPAEYNLNQYALGSC
jgi:hypothetical protein